MRRFARYVTRLGLMTASASCVTSSMPARPQSDVSLQSEMQFGTLPPDPLLSMELSGIRTEIAFSQLVPPSAWAGRLPPSLAPVTLKIRATRDTAAASFLADHPEYADHAFGILSFVLLDTMRLGNSHVAANRPIAFAFWWIFLDKTDTVDARALGDASLELDVWHGRDAAIAPLRSAGVRVSDAEVGVTQIAPKTWQARL